MQRKSKRGTGTETLPVLFVRLLLAALLSAGAPRLAHAQFLVRTWLPWRTIETPHFALHYPANLEDWTRTLATHVESIDSAVARDVGYAPNRRTQIVVDNPYSSPNGSAWPFLNQPVIELWATPPDPREDIGEFRDWGEMLVSHEFTHIAHLTRPSRNGFIRHLWQALPVDLGPIALNAPRWAIEGYATYVEGRVTGSGRPHGAWRAAFLREWAVEGQLPRYDQLNASGAYDGGEFAWHGAPATRPSRGMAALPPLRSIRPCRRRALSSGGPLPSRTPGGRGATRFSWRVIQRTCRHIRSIRRPRSR
jgi:hypothetical protein